ncbi:MAG: transporter substrate-binding domain-containing protein [Acidimicrobiia bacterium]
MKNSFRLVALLAALTLVVAACGEDGETGGDGSDLTLVSEGTLTVCTDAPYPPMEMEDADAEGGYTGFDIELMRAIADDLGLGLAVNNTGFDPITSGLAMEAGDCDVAAASITINEEREENIDFSESYFTADQSLLASDESGLTALADFGGSSIAVQSGTTGEMYAQENAPDDAELVSFENPGDTFLALEAGTVQGVLQDIVPNAEYALNNEGFSIVETYPTDESYGFAVKEEGAEDVLAAINASLAKLRDDGTYDQIYADWFE